MTTEKKQPKNSSVSPADTITVSTFIAFSLLYLSYVVAYICRRNYGFWLNGLLQRGDMDATSASVFGSTMELAYGAGKLAAGPIADNFAPKRLLISTLLVASLCNAFMFQTQIYLIDIGLWAINGIAQAFIWPALAMIFFNWFGTSKAKGTLYSILSTNQNVGSAVTPLLLTPLVKIYDWRVALWGPAVIGGAFVICLSLFLEESPKRKEGDPAKSSDAKTASTSNLSPGNNEYVMGVKKMLTSPEIWFLGLGYALLTTVRVGMSDWGLVLLRTHRESKEGEARDCLVALEFGGFIGGLFAGFLSDAAFRGRRVPVMVLFSCAIAAPALWGIFFGPGDLITVFYFIFGFGAFGPHVLVGLLARELFPTVSSTAGTFAKSLAQIGGAFSGVPVSLLVSSAGWGTVGYAWVSSAALAGLAFAFMLSREGKALNTLKTKAE
jgi:sugar phosphate permease